MGIPPRRVWSAAPLGLGQRGLVPSLFDVIVFVIIAAIFAALAHGAREMNQSLAQRDIAPVVLDPAKLPEYALLYQFAERRYRLD
jgi:NitT/TauT family transport system permease protein